MSNNKFNELNLADRPPAAGGHLLLLLSSLEMGGSERKTIRIANRLAGMGWQLTIAYLNGPDTLRNEILPSVNLICLQRVGKCDVAVLRRLQAYMGEAGVDTVCCINLYPLLYGFLLKHFSHCRRNFRLMATTNETNFVHRKDALKMAIYAPMLRRVSRLVFGSAYQQQLWIEKYHLPPARCNYIHNGVDTAYFRLDVAIDHSGAIRQNLGIPENAIVIGSVGRFRKEKQYQFVIRACVSLRQQGLNVHCLLVGGGFEEQNLRQLIAELDCESYVHLVDSEDDVRPYLAAMDVFVLSSISETFSNAALEAMAMKLPLVLPRVGGCPEMVEHGKTGFIYEPGDMQGFVDYLRRLVTDTAMRTDMGQAARDYVEAHFSFQYMIDEYASLFSAQA